MITREDATQWPPVLEDGTAVILHCGHPYQYSRHAVERSGMSIDWTDVYAYEYILHATAATLTELDPHKNVKLSQEPYAASERRFPEEFPPIHGTPPQLSSDTPSRETEGGPFYAKLREGMSIGQAVDPDFNWRTPGPDGEIIEGGYTLDVVLVDGQRILVEPHERHVIEWSAVEKYRLVDGRVKSFMDSLATAVPRGTTHPGYLPNALDIVTAAAGHMKDRAATYDKPQGERSMAATVSAFNAITGHKLTEEQGWLMMTILKAVRSQQGSYRADNYEDGTAYFALMGEAAAKSGRNDG